MILHAHAETIRIRISSQHKIRILFFRIFQSKGKGFRRFRIRIGDRREVAVRFFLLRDHEDVLEAEFFQYAACRDISRTVQRRINNLQILSFRIDCFLMQDMQREVACVSSLILSSQAWSPHQ